MRLVDQRAAISGAVEDDFLPPRRSNRLVVTEHRLPCGAGMRRFDQGIGPIAKLPFAVGELELRGFQADAAGCLGAEPTVHVVVAEILTRATEITAAATSKHKTRCKQREKGCGRTG